MPHTRRVQESTRTVPAQPPRGRAFSWRETGPLLAGLRPWKARCAADISPPKRWPAPRDSKTRTSSRPTCPQPDSCACSPEPVSFFATAPTFRDFYLLVNLPPPPFVPKILKTL